MRQWYVAYTKPRKEDWANLNLQHMEVPTLLPKYRLKDRRGRTHLRPLFPRYLFVHLDLSLPSWLSVRYARGVSRLVSFSEDMTPSPVSDDVIASIRQHQDAEGLVRLIDAQPAFRPGDAVLLVNGSFEGREAIFSSYLKDGERVMVLLHLMERQVEVVLRVDQLKRSAIQGGQR